MPGGVVWCARHRAEEGETPDRSGVPFRRRLEAASYQALLGDELTAVLAEAAARPLSEEIGALRVTLARLLVEEEDVARLATSVARVAAVAVQAARAQAAIGREEPDDMAAAIVRSLEELGKA